MGAVLRGLMARFSVEITPREAPTLPPLADVLPAGTAVYLTFLPNTPWEQTVATARSVREAGMRPVPHLAARAVPDRADAAAHAGRRRRGRRRGAPGPRRIPRHTGR